MKTPLIDQERQLRFQIWQSLHDAGGPSGLSPELIRQYGVYGGASGIWMDKKRTIALTTDGVGVTVGVLHTGETYADDLSVDGVIYHYPITDRKGRGEAEIAATKAARTFALPIFVITLPRPTAKIRDVHLGWVEDWDDVTHQFLISFGGEPSSAPTSPSLAVEKNLEVPFTLTTEKSAVKKAMFTRQGQQRFKFHVLKRYGPCCAVCDINIPELLDAAHLRPKSANGSDDPRNGIALCALHHRALDAGLFRINPDTLDVTAAPHLSLTALRITRTSLEYMAQKPHHDALSWRWDA